MRIRIFLALYASLLAFLPRYAAARYDQPPSILYIGDAGSDRERAVTLFLRQHFKTVKATNRAWFRPAKADAFDVVVLDWPQGPWNQKPNWGASLVSPLGPREKWIKPTVLLGSAGLNLAVAWKLEGGSGCTCLQPLAYGLENHQAFSRLLHLPLMRTISIPTPEAFQNEIKLVTIRVAPLVDDVKRSWPAGWCSYATDFSSDPDTEYICGGVNDKTSTAAAVWRQGNLLHFGFEQSPAEMNDSGRNLLNFSIVYISRFSQDRPIAYTPSPFAGRVAMSRARVIQRFSEYKMEWIKQWISDDFSPQLAGQLAPMDKGKLIAWANANAKFLRPDESNRLQLDPDLQSLNMTFDQPELLDRVVRDLDGPLTDEERARRLAERYLPDMPAESAGSAAVWVRENRHYLFASDAGDYRWYIDPLAKERRTPTAQLRGPEREG